MSDDHGLPGDPHAGRSRKVLTAALVITVLFTLVEFAGGLLSNSLSLVSDAGHMLTDSLALILALLAVFFTQKPADQQRTYGYHRTEILAALINGSLLIFISLYIFYQAYRRISSPPEVRSGLMLAVAGVGLLANIAGAYILRGSSRDNLNVRSAFLHMVGDMVSSIGVIVAAIVIKLTGWSVADPIVAILVGIIIFKGALGLILEAGNVLLEAVPRGVDFDTIYRRLKEIDGVNEIHDLHIWTIGTGRLALSCHILIDDQMVSNSGLILDRIGRLLAGEFNVRHTTIQLECRQCADGLICNLLSPHREPHAGSNPSA